jgi:hypothetical protein
MTTHNALRASFSTHYALIGSCCAALTIMDVPYNDYPQRPACIVLYSSNCNGCAVQCWLPTMRHGVRVPAQRMQNGMRCPAQYTPTRTRKARTAQKAKSRRPHLTTEGHPQWLGNADAARTNAAGGNVGLLRPTMLATDNALIGACFAALTTMAVV